MPVFTYKAIGQEGEKTSGTVPAASRAAALEAVAQRGLVPVAVDEQRPASQTRTNLFGSVGRVSQASVEAFNRELANLLAAGVSMSRALSILAREAAQPAARKQWAAIHDDVAGGMALADAMAKWPRSFPPVQVAMVQAGETGGFLDVVLEQIASFRSRERDLKGRVRSAMVYPVILAVLATAVLVFLLTYFIPRFSEIFAQFGENLPALTRGVVAVSHAVTEYGLVIAGAAALAVILARRAISSPSGRLTVERALLRVPVLGRVVARFALVRFCRMLGTLLGAGVPLVASLKVAREAIGNQVLAQAVGVSTERVQQGKPLARSLAANARLFPASVVEMIAVAEESGRLDDELRRLAGVYEGELDRQLRMLVSLAEPALLFVMATIVGTIVIGMLLPVFTLQEFIR
ncbi:MAG TPA: type II secretion system F family protein [Phycisphaerae bacterium]|nr:type II secretion system F family protein [Phycisphaerae bacterium]